MTTPKRLAPYFATLGINSRMPPSSSREPTAKGNQLGYPHLTNFTTHACVPSNLGSAAIMNARVSRALNIHAEPFFILCRSMLGHQVLSSPVPLSLGLRHEDTGGQRVPMTGKNARATFSFLVEECAEFPKSLVHPANLPDSIRTGHLQCWRRKLCCRPERMHKRALAACRQPSP